MYNETKQAVTLGLVLVIALGALMFALSGCAQDLAYLSSKPGVVASSILVKATAQINIDSATIGVMRTVTNPDNKGTSNVSVTITNNASETFSLAAFTPSSVGTQTASTALVDLGSISVSSLFDNDLYHCGTGNTHKCTTAGFGAFWSTSTTGLANSNDVNELMPLSLACSAGGLALTVLNVSSSTSPLLLDVQSIPSSEYNVQMGTGQTFVTVPSFDIQVNFTGMGDGTFSGTFNVVYFISN